MKEDRLWQRIMELGSIGAHEDSGGVTRLSFTEEERQAKNRVIQYMKEAGLTVREDHIGNVIGRKEGKDPLAPVVLTGSHIDTVPHGGKFDGALGVLAAIEALQQMNEQGIETHHPIEVMAFTDEEGSRFGVGMLGSRALAGTLTLEQLTQTDEQGLTIAEVMRRAGYEPEKLREAAGDPAKIKGYVELHIEQGTVLERNNLPVGIVSGIAGPLWLQFTLTGQAGHAGATPMNARRDPLACASEIMSFIYQETKKYPNAVATVGKIRALPGGVNVIPEQVEFTLDLRDIDETVRNQLEGKIRNYAEQASREQVIQLEISLLQRVAPAPCSSEITSAVKAACQQAGLSPFTLVSGAGHDGMQFTDFCPIGMIFVRSREGISHSPLEWSTPDDCRAGTEVLYHTLIQLAQSR
ncbi:Zn-dependent hydrolase [Paenibacillus kribbensis]|uniref:Zn-dependent hydrolase n=1 Tax=Paenibacillus kribbensis TaxID=172713 RepID=UPI002DBCBBAA|nr:Zn-dependent hydrolase [Paenibacillus kribbensis]MEC0237828.1 Zn-dependent hydrolase [Paenibacillus kribbensis]